MDWRSAGAQTAFSHAGRGDLPGAVPDPRRRRHLAAAQAPPGCRVPALPKRLLDPHEGQEAMRAVRPAVRLIAAVPTTGLQIRLASGSCRGGSRCRLPVAIASGDTMAQRALVYALTLTAVGLSVAPEAAGVPSRQAQPAWHRTDSRRFEIHHLSVHASELERVVRSGERAYERVSRRLNFVLGTKVPLVMFTSSGPMTRDQVVAYAISDRVAPQQPHPSRIVLPLPAGDAGLDALLAHELSQRRAHRPARGQDLRRGVRTDARGVRRSFPALRGTPIRPGGSLTFRSAEGAPGTGPTDRLREREGGV
jgi:hypothetical protein